MHWKHNIEQILLSQNTITACSNSDTVVVPCYPKGYVPRSPVYAESSNSTEPYIHFFPIHTYALWLLFGLFDLPVSLFFIFGTVIK